LESSFYIKVENVQKLVDVQDPELTARKTLDGRNAFDWTFFNTFAEINTWLDSKVSAYPDVLTALNYGSSLEGRPLRVFRYSEKSGNPAAFIEANLHAREWASSAAATWIINELLTSTDPSTRAVANSVDWYIVVVANPDGFVFSHESTRLWRKTRRPQGTCIGTDANRNFDFFWMTIGASDNPCSDTYAGPAPFSDPETAAMRDFYGTIAPRVRLFFLSIHAFGQYILYPYGYTTSPSNNNANLMSVGNAAATAIRNISGTDYLVGIGSVVLYPTSGSTIDWAFGVHNTRLSFVFEVRPIRGSNNGFLLPPNQIIPCSVELWSGIKAMVAQARALGEM